MSVFLHGANFSGGVFWPRQRHRVFWRRHWGAPWIPVTWAFCRRVRLAAWPMLSEAEITLDFGLLYHQVAGGWMEYPPVQLSGGFVQVVLYGSHAPQVLFTGVVPQESYALDAAAFPSGVQSISAFGLEWLLERMEVQGSITEHGQIDQTLNFNGVEQPGMRPTGNRSAGTGFGDVHHFSRDGELWSNLDIARYLLYWFAPSGPPWVLAGQLELIEMIRREQRVAGMDLWSALKHLIDAKRGVGARVVVWGDVAVIEVFSTLDIPLQLESGAVMPPAVRRASINLNALPGATATITEGVQHQYREVLVMGGPVYSCCTLGYQDGTLEAGWTAQQEAAYKFGVNPASTQALNDAERRTDKLAEVYTRYRVPGGWNGTVHGVGAIALPEVTNLAQLVPWVAPVWAGALRFERWLPFVRFTGTGVREFRDPVAFVRWDDGKGGGFRWYYADAMEKGPASLTMLEGEPAIRVNPYGLDHVAALHHFNEDDANTGPSEDKPVWDWQEMMVTVNFETGRHLRVRAFAGFGSNGGVKVIRVPDAQVWYVTPGTIVEVENGEIVRYGTPEWPAADGFMNRNDAPRLRQVALQALAWYGIRRSQVRIDVPLVLPAFTPGTMIDAVARGFRAGAVRSPVTSVEFDFESFTTRWTCEYGEPDFAEMGEAGNG